MTKNKYLILFIAILFPKVYATQSYVLANPISYQESVSPSSISSKESSFMLAIQGMPRGISYHLKCNLSTTQNNDPIYIDNTNNDANFGGILLDGKSPINNNANLPVKNAGHHIVELDISLGHKMDITLPILEFRNMSEDTITINNCTMTTE